MKEFDFTAPAVLHVGCGSATRMVALALALATTLAAVAPAVHAQAAQPPHVTVARSPGAAEIGARLGPEMAGLSAAVQQRRLQLETDRISEMRTNFRANVEAVAREHGIDTCFGGFLDGHADRTDIERSTLLLVARTAEGRTLDVSSGFVVRDSAVEGHNRVVTARHVLNAADTEHFQDNVDYAVESARKASPQADDHTALTLYLSDRARVGFPAASALASDILAGPAGLPDAQRSRIKHALGIEVAHHIDAYASDGAYVGRMATVAMGQPDGAITQVTGDGPDGIGRTAIDWGVAQPDARWTPASALQRFDAIAGLDIAPLQASEKSWGVSGDESHPAATPGYSGGPVVDAAGRVHGIVSAVDVLDDVVRAQAGGMLSPAELASGWRPERVEAQRTQVDMPMRQPLVVNPLGAPALLSALGRAGMGIRVGAGAPLHSGHERMTMVGMPGGYCAAAPTVQGRLSSAMPDVRTHVPGTPTAWEVRKSRNGSEMRYDSDGHLRQLTQPDGTQRIYKAGVMVSLVRPDGTATSYQDGMPLSQGAGAQPAQGAEREAPALHR